LDLQLGKADLAELSEDTARRAQRSNVKVWSSAPLTLYVVKFATPAKSESERTLREALAWSLDRNAMARVLLQRQAEAAPCFLPQWLSGYAFLFAMENDLERARELRVSLPAGAVGAMQPLRVSLDSNNELAKLIAERVAVSAHAAGLTLQIAPKAAARASSDGTAAKSENEAQLIVWRYTSLSPRQDLEILANAWHRKIPESGMPAEAEARYAWEKRMMDEKDILPLVTVPDFAALDARVRNWSPAPWGEWRLGDVWLDSNEPSANARDAAKSSAGAKP
jgi:ABC-type transport system substrate-binding protein